jgi:chromosome segregation ATPase
VETLQQRVTQYRIQLRTSELAALEAKASADRKDVELRAVDARWRTADNELRAQQQLVLQLQDQVAALSQREDIDSESAPVPTTSSLEHLEQQVQLLQAQLSICRQHGLEAPLLQDRLADATAMTKTLEQAMLTKSARIAELEHMWQSSQQEHQQLQAAVAEHVLCEQRLQGLQADNSRLLGELTELREQLSKTPLMPKMIPQTVGVFWERKHACACTMNKLITRPVRMD